MDASDVSQRRIVESQVRVRYAETDAEGVVYYANHFVYMEVGRVDYLHALGFDPSNWDRRDSGMVIVEASCRYRSPARFYDQLTIRTWVDEVRHSSFALAYDIVHQDGRLIANGRTVQVFVNLRTMRPVRLPAEMREALNAAECAHPLGTAAALPLC
jgi:acyl-CoA thioester hydrolase